MNDIFGRYKEIMRRIPNLTKAKNLLGYEPKVKIKDAIEFTIKAMNIV